MHGCLEVVVVEQVVVASYRGGALHVGRCSRCAVQTLVREREVIELLLVSAAEYTEGSCQDTRQIGGWISYR